VQLLDLTVAVVELPLQLDLAVQAVEVGLAFSWLRVMTWCSRSRSRGSRERDVHVQRTGSRIGSWLLQRGRLVLVQPEPVGDCTAVGYDV